MMNLEWAYSSCPNDSKATIDTKEKVTRLDFILDYYKLSGTWSDNASMLLYIAWRGKVIISSVLAQEIWENWQSNEYLSSNRDDFFCGIYISLFRRRYIHSNNYEVRLSSFMDSKYQMYDFKITRKS